MGFNSAFKGLNNTTVSEFVEMFPVTQFSTLHALCHNHVWKMAWYTSAIYGEMPKAECAIHLLH